MSLLSKHILLGLVVVSMGFFASTASAFAQNRVPRPIEAAHCSDVANTDELPNARFKRKGGRSTPSKVLFSDGELTVADVAQGRDLKLYDVLKLNPKSRTVVE